MVDIEEFGYKGIKGVEGYRAFSKQLAKVETEMARLVDFIVFNKDLINDWDKRDLARFLKYRVKQLRDAGIDYHDEVVK